MKYQFNIALIGEVDAGKSTTLGQILMKTGSVLESRVKEADRASRAQNKDFEPAFLLDAFEYERQNEMTVDITSVACRYQDLDIRFLDTPGHRKLSNKFIGGACYADLALLILDSTRPCVPEHFRHAQMLRTLGLRNFAVIINKWEASSFKDLNSYLQILSPHLNSLNSKIHFTLPVSAKTGTGFEELLISLRDTLLNLPTSQEVLVIFKKNPISNQYWMQFEQGEFSQKQLFDGKNELSVKNIKACGERISLVQIDRPSSMAAHDPKHILFLKNFKPHLVPLDDGWQTADLLRTKWGSLPANASSLSIILSQEWPFFIPNNRQNLFTLEKSGRILAVGIPAL